MAELPNPLAAVQQGQNWIDGLFAQRAQREAGAALAQGNYGAAANTLFRSGDLAAGQGVRGVEQQNVARQQATTEAQRARSLETTLAAARALRSTRDSGGDVAAELARLRPTFIAMGTDPNELQQIEGAIAQNPAFIDDVENIVGQQLRELQFINLGEGNAIAVDEGTGETVQTYSAPRRPQRVAVGNDYIEVGEDGQVRPLYQGARPPEYRSVRNSDGTETIIELGGRPGGVMAGGGSGEGFATRAEVLDFIAPIVGDFRPTSGARSRAEQDALIARGATSAYNSAHVGGLGQDIVPSAPREEWDRIADDLRATGRFGRVIVESGSGRNQGTGAHIHLEPRTGGGQSAPAAGNAPRVVAAGVNNGLSPSEQRMADTADRADRGAQSQLRREFNARPEVREFRTVESAYNNVRSAAANPSAAGDLSLIFAYMKMLDPNSVVREQEFANAQNAAGVPDRVRNLYNRALNGQRLNPNQRRDFTSQAESLYSNQRRTFDRIESEYRQEAELSGYDPNRIVPQRPAEQSQPRSRLGFTPNEAQTTRRRQLVPDGQPSGAPAGSARNPYIINPNSAVASRNNVPSGALFIDTDGQVKRKR